MSDRVLAPGELAGLLARIRLPIDTAATPAGAAGAQMDVLLARIEALTAALRHAGTDETARAAERLLLSDLALVASHFRAMSNELSVSLARALEGARAVLDRTRPNT